jgi:hypothetical protein
MSNFTNTTSNGGSLSKKNIEYFEKLYSEIDKYGTLGDQNEPTEKNALPLKEPLDELETFLKDCENIISNRKNSLSLKHPDEVDLIPLDMDNIPTPVIKHTPDAFYTYSPSPVNDKKNINEEDLVEKRNVTPVSKPDADNKMNITSETIVNETSELDTCSLSSIVHMKSDEKNVKEPKTPFFQRFFSFFSYFLCIKKKVNVTNSDTINQI